MRASRSLQMESLERREVFTAIPGIEVSPEIVITEQSGQPIGIDVWEHAFVEKSASSATVGDVVLAKTDVNDKSQGNDLWSVRATDVFHTANEREFGKSGQHGFISNSASGSVV